MKAVPKLLADLIGSENVWFGLEDLITVSQAWKISLLFFVDYFVCSIVYATVFSGYFCFMSKHIYARIFREVMFGALLTCLVLGFAGLGEEKILQQRMVQKNLE